MNNDKMIQFVKRWRALEEQRKNLDFERSKFCRDLRAEFPKGSGGDHEFSKWCEVELGLTLVQSQELLTRANAATVVPDEKTWNMVGGYKAISALEGIPRRQQVDVIEAVKSTGKAVRTVMRERGLGHATPVAPIKTSRPAPVINIVRRPANDVPQVDETEVALDAQKLAKYIAHNCKNIPRDILKLIAKYTSARSQAA